MTCGHTHRPYAGPTAKRVIIITVIPLIPHAQEVCLSSVGDGRSNKSIGAANGPVGVELYPGDCHFYSGRGAWVERWPNTTMPGYVQFEMTFQVGGSYDGTLGSNSDGLSNASIGMKNGSAVAEIKHKIGVIPIQIKFVLHETFV